MASTKYQTQTQNPGSKDWTDRDVARGSKDGSIALATKIVSEERIPARVVTVGKGTVVWSGEPSDIGRRAIRTPKDEWASPYTRIAPSPVRNADGIADAPMGWETCYVRARRGVALIRNAAKRNDYAIMNAWTGNVLTVGIETTREASDAMKDFTIKRDDAAAFDSSHTVIDYALALADA